MKLPLLTTCLVLGAATFALAQTDPSGRPGPRRGPGGPGRGPIGQPVVRAVDANRDGVLSAEEIQAAPQALKALDQDHDGVLSAAELRPARPANAPTDAPKRPAGAPNRPDSPPADRPRPLDPVMLALDADRDGALAATEIDNAPTSLKTLDRNNDGNLTRDEYRPLPPERPERPASE